MYLMYIHIKISGRIQKKLAGGYLWGGRGTEGSGEEEKTHFSSCILLCFFGKKILTMYVLFPTFLIYKRN